MKTISFWNLKGGVGKTTLALNVAECLHTHGHKVQVVDRDKQRSCLMFKDSLPFPISQSPMKGDFDYLLTDYPASLDGKDIQKCDLLIVPIYPGAIDLHAFLGGIHSLPEGQKVRVVVNFFRSNVTIHNMIFETLKKRGYDVHTIAEKMDFNKASLEMQTLFSYPQASYVLKDSIEKLVADL